MPNGGPDNCANCGFNSANEGESWHPGEDVMTTSSCTIRDGIPITSPAYTYCRNFRSRSTTEAIGAIYAKGLDENPHYERIPWHGASEPTIDVPAVCVVCGREVEKGTTVALDRRTVVGACSNDHYRLWWTTAHPGDLVEPLDSHEWGVLAEFRQPK